jgi:hypothetical protein
MNAGIFEFQSMMNSVIGGIGGSLLASIQTFAYVLMTICLVLGIYEAYVKGGDIRTLAATFLKYAVAAFVIGYWTNFFSDLYTGFNQIANTIDQSYGAGDLAATWLSGLQSLWNSQGYNSIFTGIAFSPSAIMTVLEIFLAYIIYPIAVQIFALIYTFWGSCLFAMGPLVIALAPSSVVNSLTKYYALNLAVWNAWTIIYAVFGCLITAIHGNDVNAVANGSLAAFGMASQEFGALGGGIEMIGLISIIYAICILLIPMVAAFILRGQFSAVGSAVATVVSKMANGGISGARAGMALGPAGAAGGAAVGAGMGLLGVTPYSMFSGGSWGGGGGGQPAQGGSGGGTYSTPPPNTPSPNNPTRTV